ncbi:MAG TPA: hypothetical protein VGB16_06120 [candidate division Zixibacteria bacterium]
MQATLANVACIFAFCSCPIYWANFLQCIRAGVEFTSTPIVQAKTRFGRLTISSSLSLRAEGLSLCFDFAQHHEFIEWSKDPALCFAGDIPEYRLHF